MKRFLLALALASQLHAGYYYRAITFASKAVNTDRTNFPVYMTGTLSYLATIANGGRIANTVSQSGGGAAITVPADFVITSDSGCTTALAFEWESYTASTGAFNLWFKIGTLHTGSTDTVYMCYGNAAVSTFQGNVNSTWNSNFKLVLHLPSATTPNDSTSNALNATATNTPTNTTGQIDGAASFAAASSQYMGKTTGFPTTWTTFSVSYWFNLTTLPTAGNIRVGVQSSQSANGWLLGINSSGHPDLTERGVANNPFSSLTVTAGHVYYIEATRNGTSAICYLYDFTNSSSANQTITVNNSSFSGDGGYLLASLDGQAAAFFWNGWLDEGRVVTVTDSADWINTSYNNQSSPSTFYAIGAEHGATGFPIIQ